MRNSEFGMRKWNKCGSRNAEFGSGTNAEFGIRNAAARLCSLISMNPSEPHSAFRAPHSAFDNSAFDNPYSINSAIRIPKSRCAMSDVCLQTDLKDLKLFRRGKVRDVYEVDNRLLMIATDRISAFDVVLPTPIPMKGAILTQLSRFWFGMMEDIVGNHLISADVDHFPDVLRPHRDVLRLRSMLVARAEIFPIECVARGYLAGAGWKGD